MTLYMAGPVISFVSQDILSKAVTVGLDLLGSVVSTQLKAELEKLDIEVMLKTVKTVVSEVHVTLHSQFIEANQQLNPQSTLSSQISSNSTLSTRISTDCKQSEADSDWEKVDKNSLVEIGNNTEKLSDGHNLHALELGIINLEDIIQKINYLLTELHNEEDHHRKKWFWKWRSVYYGPLLSRLTSLCHILDRRLDLFVKIIAIKNLTTLNYTPKFAPHPQLPDTLYNCQHSEHSNTHIAHSNTSSSTGGSTSVRSY